jgi:hypothetical protein
MHHDASWDAPPKSFIKPHAKYKHGGGANAWFCRNIIKAKSFIKPHAKYKHGGGKPMLGFAGIS